MEQRPCVGQFGLTVQRCVASSQMAYVWPCKLCLGGGKSYLGGSTGNREIILGGLYVGGGPVSGKS